MLKIGKARAKELELCKEFRCPECESHVAPKISRTSKPKNTTHFGERVGFGLIELELSCGTKVTGVNMVDSHTSFQIV